MKNLRELIRIMKFLWAMRRKREIKSKQTPVIPNTKDEQYKYKSHGRGPLNDYDT